MAALLVLAAGSMASACCARQRPRLPPRRTKLGEAYTAAKLASLRAANRPVFVDATAAWCITCLVNEDAVLSRDSVKSAFAAKKVAYLVADWTNQNPRDHRAAEGEWPLRRAALSLLCAGRGKTPVILPQILDRSTCWVPGRLTAANWQCSAALRRALQACVIPSLPCSAAPIPGIPPAKGCSGGRPPRMLKHAACTAATTSALRRATQRTVLAGGRIERGRTRHRRRSRIGVAFGCNVFHGGSLC